MRQKFNNETNVKEAVRTVLGQRGWFQWAAAASGFSVAGVSDRLAVRDGIPVAIEVKYAAGKPTPLQHTFLVAFQMYGGHACWVNEKSLTIGADGLTPFEHWLIDVEEGEDDPRDQFTPL